MKKVISIALVLFLGLSLFAGCGPADEAVSPPTPPDTGTPDTGTPDTGTPDTGTPDTDEDVPEIVIGLFQPATGMNGAGGRQESLGTYFAHYRQPYVYIDGVRHNVRIESVDNESDNARGPVAAAELVARGIHFVLGSYGSAVSMASSSVFDEAGLTAMGVSCTNPGVTRDNDFYFRVCFLDPFQGQALAALAANTLNADKAYILSLLGDDYSQGLANFFKEAFQANGGEVFQEDFPAGTSDFSAFMNAAAAFGAGVIFAPTAVSDAVLIIDAAAVTGVGIPLLAGDTWDSPQIIDAIRGNDVNLMVTTFYQEGGAPEWDADFKAWLNTYPDRLMANGGSDVIAGFTAMGYDAYMLALDIFARSGVPYPFDQEAIRRATWETSFQGPVAGLIEFNETGDARRNIAFVKTVDSSGEWKFYTAQTVPN